MFTHPGAPCNPLPPVSPEFHAPDAANLFNDLRLWVRDRALDGTAAHEVERGLFDRLLAIGFAFFAGFLRLVGPGDLGEVATLDDGTQARRLEGLHARRLLTVFGSFTLRRHAYAAREGQKLDLIPTDQRLGLPRSEVSYLLQEWDQLLGVEHAFGKARDTIEAILRIRQSVDTMEGTNRQMAESAPEFRESQPPVDPAKEGELLIVTEDNKGVPMVRPVDQQPAGAHRKKGEKANKKQMATIGCVYSVDRHERTPEGLVATLFKDADRPRGEPPQAKQKRYWVGMSHQADGEKVRGQDVVFGHMGQEVKARRKEGQVLVHLCDGQESLQADRVAHLPTDERTVEVLDLMHVIPRLWEAAHVFAAEGSAEASDFVRGRLLRVLRGESAAVVRGLRRMGSGLPGARKARLSKACNFLAANEGRMRYGEYLGAGYPVATGVIEGACRHVIKDRMERAGMRWQLPGAMAMLHLRAIHANGDWEDFQAFRVKRENERLYTNLNALRDANWTFSLSI